MTPICDEHILTLSFIEDIHNIYFNVGSYQKQNFGIVNDNLQGIESYNMINY